MVLYIVIGFIAGIVANTIAHVMTFKLAGRLIVDTKDDDAPDRYTLVFDMPLVELPKHEYVRIKIEEK